MREINGAENDRLQSLDLDLELNFWEHKASKHFRAEKWHEQSCTFNASIGQHHRAGMKKLVAVRSGLYRGQRMGQDGRQCGHGNFKK